MSVSGGGLIVMFTPNPASRSASIIARSRAVRPVPSTLSPDLPTLLRRAAIAEVELGVTDGSAARFGSNARVISSDKVLTARTAADVEFRIPTTRPRGRNLPSSAKTREGLRIPSSFFTSRSRRFARLFAARVSSFLLASRPLTRLHAPREIRKAPHGTPR
jgi:hypothetical protein